MNGLMFNQSFNKDLLRHVVNLKKSKFNRDMNLFIDEVLKVSPRYNKLCSILSPIEFSCMLEQFGIDDLNVINERIKSYYHPKK